MSTRSCAELYAVTAYFNPCRYKSRFTNYKIFAEHLKHAGVPLLTVECAFGDQPFELGDHEGVMQVRARDVMWLKERLINIGIAALPTCRAVAWLDCDLVFLAADWPERSLRALEEHHVIQPFTTVSRVLPEEFVTDVTNSVVHRSYCSTVSFDAGTVSGSDHAAHGHTGFAWVARKDLLDKHGLYDLCLSGSGDHLMAHGFWRGTRARCVDTRIPVHTKHWRHFEAWANAVARDVVTGPGSIEGHVVTLWHGKSSDRNYHVFNREFREFDFDPDADVMLGESGCWQWKDAPTELRLWGRRYFERRREDVD
jgi:hypothetical protein